MDVCCFEEESSDTIIYCFCAGLETVKGAVVNPEVETPSTLVSPCATSGLLAPSAVAAPIKCSGGSASHFGCHDRRAQCSPDVEINLYQLFGVGALAHRGLLPVRGQCGQSHWLTPHCTFLPVRAVQVTATPCLREDRFRADW